MLINTGRTWYQDPAAGRVDPGHAWRASTRRRWSSRWGTSWTRCPRRWWSARQQLKLPILTLPAGALTRSVLSYVYNVLASADLHRLRRTVALQNDLLDLLIAEAGPDELLAKVATLIGMPMLLLDGVGAVITSSGVTDPRRMAQEVWEAWGELTDPTALGIIEVGASRYFCREVILYGKLEVLIVASAEQTSSTEFVDTALSFLQRLITLDLLKRRDEIVATRRLRRRLLRDLLDGAPRRTSSPRSSRTTAWTWTGPGGWPSATSAARGTRGAARSSSRTHWWRRSTRTAATASSRSSAGRGRRHLPSCCPTAIRRSGTAAPATSCSASRRSPPASRTGCSSPSASPARTAAPAPAPRRSRRPSTPWPPRSGASTPAASSSSRSSAGGSVCFRARAAVRSPTSRGAASLPLLEYDARRHTHLLDTLRTLLDNHFAIQPTAEALFIHRNTLQKRMRRIETLLGVDLTDIDDLMELYLGLRALQLVGEAKVVGTAPARRQSRPAISPEG